MSLEMTFFYLSFFKKKRNNTAESQVEEVKGVQAENSGPHARPQAAQRQFHASFTHGQRQRRGNFTLGLMGASKSKNDFSNQVTLLCHAQLLCNCQHLYLRGLLGCHLLCSRSVLVMPVLPEARSSKSMLTCPHLTSASRGIF